MQNRNSNDFEHAGKQATVPKVPLMHQASALQRLCMLLNLGVITVCVLSPQPLNLLVKGFECLADAARHTQRWHSLAATLAGVTETDIKQASQISLPGDSAAELATVVQNVTCKLGRIADLVYELADLRLVVPALTNVQIQDGAVQLVFLGVEAELKFSVQLRIGQPLLELSADCILAAFHCACSRVAVKTALPATGPCLCTDWCTCDQIVPILQCRLRLPWWYY